MKKIMHKKELNRDHLRYLLTLLSGIILVFVSNIIPDGWPFHFSGFVKELGFALVIAGILIFTIEKYTRDRHKKDLEITIKEINENLYQAIFKRHIPESILREVEKSLLCANVFRTNYDVTYTLIPVDPVEDAAMDPQMHLRCTTQSVYTIKNITNNPITHYIKAAYEYPVDENWKKEVSVVDVTIDGKNLTQDIINECTKEKNSQLRFSYKVKIPADSSIDIMMKAKLLKRQTDMEVWSSMLPSDGIRLTIVTPTKDIFVSANANHSSELESTPEDPITRTWKLSQGMFPYQSITFWWERRTDDNPP